MQCFKPIKVYLSDEQCKERLKDSSLPTPLRVATYVYVPCGKCEACLSNRRNAWSFRLFQEMKNSESGYFLTLTYDDDQIPTEFVNINGEIHCVGVVKKKHIQDFLKRLRRSIEPFKIRYFAVSEYGPKTDRPHYHMLLFNFPHLLKDKLDEYINSAWGFGFTRVDPINIARIQYVTSYCLDSSTLPPYLPKNFMLCSRRPGLGSSYLDNSDIRDYHSRNLDNFGYMPSTSKARKVKLPRYYSDKLFSDIEKREISNKATEFHYSKRVRLINKQKKWLRSRGIEPIGLALYTPYEGSPMANELNIRDDFKRQVKNKCKRKQNG